MSVSPVSAQRLAFCRVGLGVAKATSVNNVLLGALQFEFTVEDVVARDPGGVAGERKAHCPHP